MALDKLFDTGKDTSKQEVESESNQTARETRILSPFEQQSASRRRKKRSLPKMKIKMKTKAKTKTKPNAEPKRFASKKEPVLTKGKVM